MCFENLVDNKDVSTKEKFEVCDLKLRLLKYVRILIIRTRVREYIGL